METFVILNSSRVAKAAMERGWSYVELSQRSGVSYDSVRRLLRGNSPRVRRTTLFKFANSLGVEPSTLKISLVENDL